MPAVPTQFLKTYWRSISVSLTVMVLSVINTGQIPGTDLVHVSDKAAHALLYTAVTLSALLDMGNIRLRRGAAESRPLRRRAIWLTIAGSTLYGASLEVVQLFLPYRSFSLLDMAANLAGSALGVFVYIGIALTIKQQCSKTSSIR